MDKPIGIFDSGVGGLTVLTALQKELPHENMIILVIMHIVLMVIKQSINCFHIQKKFVTILFLKM